MTRYITPDATMAHRFGGERPPPPEWDLAILCFRDPTGSRLMIDLCEAERVDQKVFYGVYTSSRWLSVYEAELHGKRLGIITCCMWGGPQAAILVEELAWLGVPRLIGYGAAGGIHPTLAIGDPAVATVGLLTDGTSRQYLPEEEQVSASPRLVAAAREAAGRLNVPLRQVVAANVDALYRETHELIESYQARGAHLVNLETSAFYAAARVCGLDALWLGYVTDTLSEGMWEDWHGGIQEGMEETAASLCRTTAEVLLQP